MALDRHQVDLSIKKTVYDEAMRRMKRRQKHEREKHGVKRTNLADIGREAIMSYRKGDGADYEARIVRSPAGQKPKREPFRFDIATSAYERQKDKITRDGHRVTQVVEEALKYFTETGHTPAERLEAEADRESSKSTEPAPQQVEFSS